MGASPSTPVQPQAPAPPFRIFVSHIHQEAVLAAAVKDGLKSAFGDRVAVFVSSDPADNPGGDRWMEEIEREMKASRMAITLISPSSLHRHWILVELGAAWFAGIKVFPLCHSGSIPEALQRPLSDFGGRELEHEEAAERLIRAVTKHSGLRPRDDWSHAKFLRDLRIAHAELPAAVPAPVAAVAAATAAADPEGPQLPAEQVKILQSLAIAENQGIEDVTAGQFSAQIQMPKAVLTYHMTKLVRQGLVQYSMYAGDTHYSISPDGTGWLLEHELMPA